MKVSEYDGLTSLNATDVFYVERPGSPPGNNTTFENLVGSIVLPQSQVTGLVSDLAGKQATGNYITALTGDVDASGPGSVAATLATVNSAPGTVGGASKSLTAAVNAKGLVTAISEQAIEIAESQVIDLVSDLAGKQTTLGYTAENVANKNQASGYAGLDSGGKINPSQLAALAISDTFVVASEVAMLALTAQTGDVAVRTDLSKSFILAVNDPAQLANWQELLTPVSPVTNVFGRTGVVTAQSNDYSFSQIAGQVTNAQLAGSITAASLVQTDIELAESQITNLTSDLAAKANAGLSNLASVAINTDLLPVSTQGLGSALFPFLASFIGNTTQYESVGQSAGLINHEALGSATNINIALMPKGTGNVGIGTTSPQGELHLSGTDGTDFILSTARSIGGANRNWRLSVDESNEGQLSIDKSTALGGYTFASVLAISNNGNVGIGTTVPKGKLAIATGTILVDTYFTNVSNPHSGAVGWHINKPAATALPTVISFDVDDVSKWEIGLDYENADFVLAYSAQDATAIGDKFRMAPDGRTCISNSCGSPSDYTAFVTIYPDSQAHKSGSYTRALDVGGAVRIFPYPGSTETTGILLDPVAPGVNTPFSFFKAFSANTSWPLSLGSVYDASNVDQYLVLNGYLDGGSKASPTFFGAPIGGSFIKDSRTGSATDGLVLGHFANGAGQTPTELVRITNAGKVGIGTTTPADLLTVNGSIGIGINELWNGNASRTAGLNFSNFSFNLSGYNGIIFNSSVAAVGSQTERLRITNAGNVGIGTTTPSGLLSLATAGVFGWGTASLDTALSRISANLVGVGTGAAGSFAGSLKLTDLTAVGRIINGTFTVSTLPTGAAGATLYVTDGDSGLVWGATITNSGSGATPYLVWYNGSAWTVVGK